MIIYSNRFRHMPLKLCRLSGSVFPRALLVALPNACITAFLTFGIHKKNYFSGIAEFEKDFSHWDSFTFLVTAFTKSAEAPEEEVKKFLNLIVRLFSTLHVSALAELEDRSHPDKIKAWNYSIIDVQGIDEESLCTLRHSSCKTELVCQWIEQLITHNIRTGVLAVPSPILSRVFQNLSDGMLHFHEASVVAQIPFPFPYSQVCDAVLVLHWLLLPCAVASRAHHEWWAACFAFVQVFFAWSLTFIAIELEHPFGSDPNDLDSMKFQREANTRLLMLVQPGTRTTPKLAEDCDLTSSISKMLSHTSTSTSSSCLSEAWKQGGPSSLASLSPMQHDRSQGGNESTNPVRYVRIHHRQNSEDVYSKQAVCESVGVCVQHDHSPRLAKQAVRAHPGKDGETMEPQTSQAIKNRMPIADVAETLAPSEHQHQKVVHTCGAKASGESDDSQVAVNSEAIANEHDLAGTNEVSVMSPRTKQSNPADKSTISGPRWSKWSDSTDQFPPVLLGNTSQADGTHQHDTKDCTV